MNLKKFNNLFHKNKWIILIYLLIIILLVVTFKSYSFIKYILHYTKYIIYYIKNLFNYKKNDLSMQEQQLNDYDLGMQEQQLNDYDLGIREQQLNDYDLGIREQQLNKMIHSRPKIVGTWDDKKLKYSFNYPELNKLKRRKKSKLDKLNDAIYSI